MITFWARMYNATTNTFIDENKVKYSIGHYFKPIDPYDNPFITHEGEEVTTIPLNSFIFSGNNIGYAFEFYAKEYYKENQVFPVLRLITTNATDNYVLEWNHGSPTSLRIYTNVYNVVWSNILQWSDSGDPSDPTTLLNSRVFVNAGTVQELNEPSFLMYFGAVRVSEDTVYTLVGNNMFNLSVSNTAALKTDANILTVDLARNPYSGRSLYYKLYEGKAIGVAGRYTSTPYGGSYAILLAPFVKVDGVNWGVMRGWDIRTTNNQAGANYQYVDYQGIRLAANYGAWGKGFDGTQLLQKDRLDTTASPYQTAEAKIELLEELGVSVVMDKLPLYEYLITSTKPPVVIPDTPDVDPDNPPDPDDPPVPPTPDDPDPYYDPTSDPSSPQYNPTKDPSSPSYDPSVPSTPWRPPTDTAGGDPPVQIPTTPVTPPPTPPSHAINSKFITLYTPSLSQLNSLAEYLWSSSWSIDSFKKIFANPMDCILGLMIFPALVAPAGSKEVNVGNLSTGVTMSYIDNQYVELNCGSLEVKEYYASYLDYDPYTKIEIYLPYIGTHRISADDVMGKTIQLKYMIDLLSGACVAFLMANGTTLYNFTGSCATAIPVSGNDWSNMVNGIISVAGAATAAAISGGSAASMASGVMASASLFVSSHKEHIRHGGSVASAAGLMSIQTPYLIITRPRQALPLNQNSFTGYPSFITESLSSLTGYTEVESIHLEHVPASSEELLEIERLLKGGVLF